MGNREKFLKRVMKYGLLRRVALPDKPWSFVNTTDCLFDHLYQAQERATCYNTSEPLPPAYVYKPVEVFLEVEIDSWIGG